MWFHANVPHKYSVVTQLVAEAGPPNRVSVPPQIRGFVLSSVKSLSIWNKFLDYTLTRYLLLADVFRYRRGRFKVSTCEHGISLIHFALPTSVYHITSHYIPAEYQSKNDLI